MNELEKLFQQYIGVKPTSISRLTASGSNRIYYRLESATDKLIGVEGTSMDENKAFIQISDHFLKQGIPVPRVLAKAKDELFYLQDDLGDQLLFDRIAEGRETGVFSETEKDLLRRTMRYLPAIQFRGAENFDFSICYPQAEFNKRSVLWDLNYFKYCFLKSTGIEFQEDLLEDDFEKLSETLLQSPTNTFMYRDFQSRNVIVKDNQLFFIDFQGGRKGPYLYDLASFLWQAKARYSDDLRKELFAEYLDELKKHLDFDERIIQKQLRYFVLFRTLQVLGAYGFRGYMEQKSHFLESVPFAIENLKSVLKNDFSEYPYLVQVLKQMCELPKFQKPQKNKKLVVTVTSFSYKKGIPNDDSGNGGGFVFDCRAIHNPGRYDEYKKLTGLDKPVSNFLEKEGEIITFLESCKALVDASVQRYLDRGFLNLMVNFGCTGGQHRSVYSAEKMAHHIYEKFGVDVKIIHREQKIERTIV